MSPIKIENPNRNKKKRAGKKIKEFCVSPLPLKVN